MSKPVKRPTPKSTFWPDAGVWTSCATSACRRRRCATSSRPSSFRTTVEGALGADVPTSPLDVTVDASIDDFARVLADRPLTADGVVHSIAMDKTTHGGEVLQRGSSVVAQSYLGAERIVLHPCKNVGVAKAALKRITRELANTAEVRHVDGGYHSGGLTVTGPSGPPRRVGVEHASPTQHPRPRPRPRCP